MEMWSFAATVRLQRLFIFLGLALVINFGLTYLAGFKTSSTFSSTIDQTFDAVAVGIVASAIILMVLERIGIHDPLDTILARITVEALPLSIGAAVANTLISPKGASRQGEQNQDRAKLTGWKSTLTDLGGTVAGGVFIGASIAPTQEVPTIAAGLHGWSVLALIALSLVITYAIVFESGFSPQRTRKSNHGLFQNPISETAMAYIVSLVVAYLSLYLFDQIHHETSLQWIVIQTVVLGLPTAVGGAAGRLVI